MDMIYYQNYISRYLFIYWIIKTIRVLHIIRMSLYDQKWNNKSWILIFRYTFILMYLNRYRIPDQIRTRPVSSVGSGQGLHASGPGSIPGRGTFPCGNLSWNLFYGNLPPTTVSSRAVVSNWHGKVYGVLVIKPGPAKQTQKTYW